MVVYTVHVQVLPGREEDFARETALNHEGTRREAGNLRFDVLQSAEDPRRFLLYEAYESPAAAAAHKETAHYRAWRDAVAPWMAEPRRGALFKPLRPQEPAAWRGGAG